MARGAGQGSVGPQGLWGKGELGSWSERAAAPVAGAPGPSASGGGGKQGGGSGGLLSAAQARYGDTLVAFAGSAVA